MFHCVKHDACIAHDVRLRRMMCLRTWVEHIASFCGETAKHHDGVAMTSFVRRTSIIQFGLPAEKKNRLISFISRFLLKCALNQKNRLTIFPHRLPRTSRHHGQKRKSCSFLWRRSVPESRTLHSILPLYGAGSPRIRVFKGLQGPVSVILHGRLRQSVSVG